MSSVLDELSSPTTSRRRLGVLCSSRSSEWTDRRRVQPLGSSSCSYAAASWLTTRRSTWGISDKVRGKFSNVLLASVITERDVMTQLHVAL